MRHATLNVDGGDRNAAVRELLTQLLQSGFVQAVLVPKPLADGSTVVQSLVVDPEQLRDAIPIAPTMPVQSAHILSDLTRTPIEGRIAAVLKPCELRAAVELTKFLQVDLENVVTISIDCFGSYDVSEYADMSPDQRVGALQSLAGGSNDASADRLREACRMCSRPIPIGVDLGVGLLSGSSGSIPLSLSDRFADELAEALSLELTESEPEGRATAVETLVVQRKEYRDKALGGFAEQTASIDNLMQTLSACIGCHNCMTVCPICYCKECVFDSAVFEHRADQFLSWAKRKGVLRVPTDTLMFHLTRLSHMGTSCVGCGVCESACPNDVPVSSLFNSLGGKLQEMFEYVPGEDPTVDPPVASFKEEELVEVAPNE
ncbi:4Fe-4S dicluster domain-containing protein [Candidatus Bipolaricaulota bacterium]|nr:4Fe-4S dicluster domain-containing protein [Candidatus Bipolaricaulota bacterium]